MNAPLPMVKECGYALQVVIQDIMADIASVKNTLMCPRVTPLEEDVRQEEALADSKRTASAIEVLNTLRLSRHTTREVSQQELLKWLSDREWPEEQSQVLHEDGRSTLLKLFKAHDGFALKCVPIRMGGQLDSMGSTYEINTLVKS